MPTLDLSRKRPPTWNDGPAAPVTSLKPLDPHAVERLHTQYAAYRATGLGRRYEPWTHEAALALGRLFMAAYGRVPPALRLSNNYGMPDSISIRRLYGTLQAYYAALGGGGNAVNQEDTRVRLADDCLGHANRILAELVAQHFPVDPPSMTLEVLPLPSCGLMGDNRVYGYAWALHGVRDFDSLATKAFLRNAGLRLTNEVQHNDGTHFVRVFAAVAWETNP